MVGRRLDADKERCSCYGYDKGRNSFKSKQSTNIKNLQNAVQSSLELITMIYYTDKRRLNTKNFCVTTLQETEQ